MIAKAFLVTELGAEIHGLLGRRRPFGGAQFNFAHNTLMRFDLYHIGTRS